MVGSSTESRTRPQQEARRRSAERSGYLLLLVGPAAALCYLDQARAQVPVTLNGPPVQVTPYVSEPGVPMIAINPGTPNPDQGGDGTETGTGDDGSGSSTTTGGSDALNTLLGTTWGLQALQNSQSLGVNASALAATCILESGCQNVGGSGAQGVFQMFPAAYQEGLNAALGANPALASQIVRGDAGRMDPTTEAIAASGYLMVANQNLQTYGISNPTVLDARGYYNFGPAYGGQLAQAANDEPIANVLSRMSASALAANGITPGETVGQWRASVSAKIGHAAGQSLLS